MALFAGSGFGALLAERHALTALSGRPGVDTVETFTAGLSTGVLGSVVVPRPFAGQAGSFSAGGAVLVGIASSGTRSTFVGILSVSLVTSLDTASILQ